MPTARDLNNPKHPVAVLYDKDADEFVAYFDYPEAWNGEGRGETRAQAVVRLEAKVRKAG